MTDLTDRLRSAQKKIDRLADAFDMRGSNKTTVTRVSEACRDAADEIERLREENKRVMSDRPYIIGFNTGWDAALEQHGKRFDDHSEIDD